MANGIPGIPTTYAGINDDDDKVKTIIRHHCSHYDGNDDHLLSGEGWLGIRSGSVWILQVAKAWKLTLIIVNRSWLVGLVDLSACGRLIPLLPNSHNSCFSSHNNLLTRDKNVVIVPLKEISHPTLIWKESNVQGEKGLQLSWLAYFSSPTYNPF